MTEYLFTEQMRARSQDICPECEQDFNTTEIVHICPGSTNLEPAVRWLMRQRRGLLVGTGRADSKRPTVETQMLMALPPLARVVLVTTTNNKMLWRDRICKWRPQFVPMWFQGAGIARPSKNQIMIVGYEALLKLTAIHSVIDGSKPLWCKCDVTKIFPVEESDAPILMIADVVDRLGNERSASWRVFRNFAKAVTGARGRVWGTLGVFEGLSHKKIVNVARAFGLEEATEDLFFLNPGGVVEHPKKGGFRFGYDRKLIPRPTYRNPVSEEAGGE